MQSTAATPQEYIDSLPEDRKEAMTNLRNSIKNNIPAGFQEVMGYGMIGYVVPHAIYPAGYHCTPQLPLPFINMASQKNYIAIYHMGLYANEGLYDWFVKEYNSISKKKTDVGKSCIRFKNIDDIPYQLIGELASKVTPQQWIAYYEKQFKNK